MKIDIAQSWGDSGLMATSAVRYCLGRRTYIVTLCADWIRENWNAFPENVREIIQRDVDREFESDDRARRDNPKDPWFPLGDDCDRKQWERVRALWS